MLFLSGEAHRGDSRCCHGLPRSETVVAMRLEAVVVSVQICQRYFVAEKLDTRKKEMRQLWF